MTGENKEEEKCQAQGFTRGDTGDTINVMQKSGKKERNLGYVRGGSLCVVTN